MSEQDILVDIRNVTYTHWNQSEPTLHGLSLQISRGTLTVLVGPSGSGKSTLCDLFNGVIPHVLGGKMEGDVWVDGSNTRNVAVKDLSQKVGRVFQDTETMFSTLYVEDEIAFGPENLCFEVADIRQTVEDMLSRTDLLERRHQLVWNLSGGQLQKLGLAAVLAMHPQLIVLDEPTANLDPGATHAVHDLLLSMRDRGVTVLLVTRELDEFLAEADRLVVIEAGRVLAAGEPRQVLQAHGDYMVNQLGVWLPETAEIGIALRQAGIHNNISVPITVAETVEILARMDSITSPLTYNPGSGNLPEANREVLITGRDLHYAYPGATLALDGVSLDVRAGEMLAIVGRNGAGKSTLAKMLVGLLRPQLGELTLFGKPARNWKIQELANEVALVLQNPEHQFLTDKVSDEIAYSLLARGISEPQQVEKAVDATLQMLGLGGYEQIHPFALSAGLKRRLGVATMLVGEPKVLLVDEPTYGQDKQMTRTLMTLMESIRARGIALVMITHDMRLVQEYAERVVVMSTGKVLYDGAFTGLFDRSDLLAQANLRPTILHELVNALRQRGIHVQGEFRNTADFLSMLQILPSGEVSRGRQ
ncbi:MAG: ABC transporter ATP-binding protein [Anaerolineales bacterium]